jgi:hypothetical protein
MRCCVPRLQGSDSFAMSQNRSLAPLAANLVKKTAAADSNGPQVPAVTADMTVEVPQI